MRMRIMMRAMSTDDWTGLDGRGYVLVGIYGGLPKNILRQVSFPVRKDRN